MKSFLFGCLTVLLVACQHSEKKLPDPVPLSASGDGITITASPGDVFLRNNAMKAGVVVTASGLQYRVLESGAERGRSPVYGDKVKVHYRGTLMDGEVFDSSYDRGQPAVFDVGGVIRGWTEALMIMKPGDRWELVIPAPLAYGPRSVGQIPPNSTLVFDVKLLEVNPR